MYAIIRTGGKQYRVKAGDVIDVEKIQGTEGEDVSLNEILLIGGDSPVVGKPFVDGAAVNARIVQTAKMEKVTIFKYKPKKDYRKKQGHRQPYTRLEILSISHNGVISEANIEES